MDKEINFQVRQIAYNVYLFFKRHSNDLVSHKDDDDDVRLAELVAKVTGLSINTVKIIIDDGNRTKDLDGVPTVSIQQTETTAPKKKLRTLNKQHIDEQTKGIIRRKVIRFYNETNDLPTIQKLNTLLRKEKILKSMNNDILKKLLLKLGFNLPDDIDAVIVERPDIALERIQYLQRMKMFRKANTNIFFLSETFYWHLTNELVKDSLPIIIVVHASGPNMFRDGDMLKMRPRTPVDGAHGLTFKNVVAVSHFADYTWVKNDVIPNLEPKSLIVMDSPPLYEKDSVNLEEPPPTALRHTITSFKDWLERNNIPYVDNTKKASLVNTIKSVSTRRDLAISKLISQSGFSVIHLPRNHNELNPTRMVWENIESEGSSEEESAFSLLEKYPPEKWAERFQDVVSLEDEYMEMADSVDVIKMQIKKEKMEPEYILGDNSEIDSEEDGPAEMDNIKQEPADYDIVIEEIDWSIKCEPGTSY